MKNKELQSILKEYPDGAIINIHVDGETNELHLDNAWIDFIVEDNLILLTMHVSNPK